MLSNACATDNASSFTSLNTFVGLSSAFMNCCEPWIRPCVSTIDVVVPSPAAVAVFSDASFTICTARFCVGSSKTIDLATDTPSFVMWIPCVYWSDSIRTVCPRAPRVLLTAFAIMSIPDTSFSRASAPNSTCLTIIFDLICANINKKGTIGPLYVKLS